MVEPQRTFTVPAGLTAIGKYQVVDRLGRGGMGTVYLARDPALDRLIAIKVLSGDLVDEETRERFSREARSISRLRHPNIVTIFEYGDFTGQPFIAMEYISGESWAELIRRRAPVPLVRKLRMMEELCAGMAHAHRARIVHRDIKPANIMVDAESGSIKILDFGIASNVASNATLATLVVGTPSYMSPEQTTGQRVDHRSDVFAVGSVFYELLSYRQAFDGDTHVTIIEKILNGQARPLDELCPSIDPEIVKIVDTAMKKDPGTRYQDLEAMRADIQSVRERVHGSGTEPTVLMDTARVALEDRAIDAYIRDARKHFEQHALTAAEQLVSEALKLRGTSPPAVAMQRELQQARWEQERAQERAVSAQAALERAHASFAAGALESAVRAASEALAHDPGLSEAQAIKDRAAAALAGYQTKTLVLARGAVEQDWQARTRTDLARRSERLRRTGVWVVGLMLAGIVLFAAVRSVRKPVGGPPDPAALSPILAPILAPAPAPVLASRLIAPGNVTVPSLNPRQVSLRARDEAATPPSGTAASPGTPGSTRTPAATGTPASLETTASTGTPASPATSVSTATPPDLPEASASPRTSVSTTTLASTGTPPPLPEPSASPGTSALAPPSPSDYPPKELDRIVSPVALYPDPLLAQLLAAATFAPEIPDAARWADQHHYLAPAALAAAVATDRLPWQPSVQALLPFPSVLDMMGSDMPWTQEIGRAFLGEPQGVMDAVQRMRRMAMDYGYLRSNPRIVVHGGPYIEILPANPAFIVVPYYKPAVVFARPQPGVVVAGAINLGFGVTMSPAFAPWGWGTTRFAWASHRVVVNNAAWGRTWANRAVYVHPYAVPRYGAARAAEQHQLIERNQRERDAAQNGRRRGEEHPRGASRPGWVRERPGTASQRPRP